MISTRTGYMRPSARTPHGGLGSPDGTSFHVSALAAGPLISHDRSGRWFLGAQSSQSGESAGLPCSRSVSEFAAHRSRWPAVAANESN
jgi:hypothetical protein